MGEEGGAGRPLTVTAGEHEGSGEGDYPGGPGGPVGATVDATSEYAAAEGAGGHHGVGIVERARVAGRQENPAGKSSGVGNREGGHEASRVA